MKRYFSIVLSVLAVPVVLGQDNYVYSNKHHHYKLIDIGSFGGPASYYANGFDGILNRHGTSAGWADTPAADPFSVSNPSFCFNVDCFVSHAFLSRNGVITDLGSLAPGWSSAATWVNDAGQIVGLSENGQTDPVSGFPEFRAVLWQNGAISELGTLQGGDVSVANAINKGGQVVGFSTNGIPDPFPGPTQTRAVLWQNGLIQDLGTLGGTDANANLINDRGQIAGGAFTSNSPNPTTGVPTLDPFLWEDGTMVDLGTLGGTSGMPTGLNDRGQVIGQSNLAGDLTFHPFLWSKHTGMQDLGTLGGNTGFVNWINDHGDIAGKADLLGASPQNHDPVLWTKGGTVIRDLGTLPGDSCGNAYYVNSRGQVVGTSETRSACLVPYGEHAFLWEDGGPLVDLNSLIAPGSPLQLTFAVAINDHGEIVGWGVPPGCAAQDYEFCGHAYVLIPCDDNHPDVAACDYSMVDGSTATTAIISAPATKVTSPITQSNPTFRGAINPMLRRIGPRFGVWNRGRGVQRPTAGSARDSKTITSEGSTLQLDDLISAHDRAEITAGLGSTSDAAANTNSCPRPLCGLHTQGQICGFYFCFYHQIRRGPLYSAYDLQLHRSCYYHGLCQ